MKLSHWSNVRLFLALVHLANKSASVVRKKKKKNCLSPDTEHSFPLLSTQQLKQQTSNLQPAEHNLSR